MHQAVVANVVRRYLAVRGLAPRKASRYTPPRGIVNGVETGELPPEVLDYWSYVVEAYGPHWDPKNGRCWAAAVQHWRNKCRKMGIVLPGNYQEGKEDDPGKLGGPGGAGRWATTPGEQIEEWVKANMKSRSLIDETGRTIDEWRAWVAHYEQAAAKTQELIDKHLLAMKDVEDKLRAKAEEMAAKLKKKGKDADLEKILSDLKDKSAGLAQRRKWIESAQRELDANTDQVDKAKAALEALKKATARHMSHKSPTVAFEAEFQFMVLQALKQFSMEEVRKAVDVAMQRVQDGVDIPLEGPMWDVSRYEPGYKSAGLVGDILSGLGKAWAYLKGAWARFMSWAKNLMNIANDIDKMMTEAGA
jgi:hypothetical protein